MKAGANVWSKAKELLLPYEGQAVSLYVLGLPLNGLATVLAKLTDILSHPQVITLDGETDAPLPLSPEAVTLLVEASNKSTHHAIRGKWTPQDDLAVWLWINGHDATFDLEFVLWGDMLFPSPDDEASCMNAFCECVGLAEMIRGVHPDSECAISASETGNPREERDKPWTMFW